MCEKPKNEDLWDRAVSVVPCMWDEKQEKNHLNTNALFYEISELTLVLDFW